MTETNETKTGERDPLHALIPFALSLLATAIAMLATRGSSQVWPIIGPAAGLGVYVATDEWWIRRRSLLYAASFGALAAAVVTLVTAWLVRYAVR